MKTLIIGNDSHVIKDYTSSDSRLNLVLTNDSGQLPDKTYEPEMRIVISKNLSYVYFECTQSKFTVDPSKINNKTHIEYEFKRMQVDNKLQDFNPSTT